jgi:hypothetical protein
MMVFPDGSTVIRQAPRLVVGAPTVVTGTPRCSQASDRRSQACGRRSQACHRCSQVLLGVPAGRCIGPANSGIWRPWDSGPATLRLSQRLPETNISYADVCTGIFFVAVQYMVSIDFAGYLDSYRSMTVYCKFETQVAVLSIEVNVLQQVYTLEYRVW